MALGIYLLTTRFSPGLDSATKMSFGKQCDEKKFTGFPVGELHDYFFFV